jgi:hypothetical protein
MSKKIRIEYFGVEGEGPTVTAAKQDAGRRLEHLVKQTEESPTIIKVGGVAALVAFQRHGWGWRLIQTTGQALNTGRIHVSSGYDKREAELGALKHVLDVAWNFPNDVTDEEWITESLKGCGVYLSLGDERQIKADALRGFGWQRRYRVARAQGYDDADAFHIAGNLPHMTKAARAAAAEVA